MARVVVESTPPLSSTTAFLDIVPAPAWASYHRTEDTFIVARQIIGRRVTAMRSRSTWWLVAALILTIGLSPGGSPAPSVPLAADGKPLLAIVIPEKPSDYVRQSAKTLATYLERISGAKFQ